MLEISCWVVLALFIASGGLESQDRVACPDETQMEMNECAGREFEAADKRLNQADKKSEKNPELVAAAPP
jgi:uncharacterized protein YecT (DUF1311 family)